MTFSCKGATADAAAALDDEEVAVAALATATMGTACGEGSGAENKWGLIVMLLELFSVL